MLQQQASVAASNAHVAYNQASYNVSRTRAVVMAYDGILSLVAKARQAIEEENPEARFNALQKACTVILGLQAALDHERGGQIAKLMDDFYFGIDTRLMRLNREPNLANLDRIANEIRTMRDAWADVDAQMSAAGETESTATPDAETIKSISVSA